MIISKFFEATKVAKAVKIANIKGSPETRREMAAKMNGKLYVMLNDTFNKKIANGEDAIITDKEITEKFSKIAPNISIVVSENKNKNCIGSMSFCNLKNIEWLSVDLPFKKVDKNFILTKEHTRTLMHEFRHVFDQLTAPKETVMDIKFSKLKNPKMHWDFYQKNLYTRSTGSNPEYIVKKLKNDILEYFDANNESSSDKITILKMWRKGLKTERNAYFDGDFYQLLNQTKKRNIQNLSKLDKEQLIHQLITTLNEERHYDEKIDLVESMLKDTLKQKMKEIALRNAEKQAMPKVNQKSCIEKIKGFFNID